MKGIFYKWIDETGKIGPIILLLLSIHLLWEKSKLLYYYLYGFLANTIINILLKLIIKEPRPSVDQNKFDLILNQSKNNSIYKKLIHYPMLGMPSGHAQSVIYSTIFIFLALKQYKLLALYLFISFITIYQRVFFNYHTIEQVIVAILIGLAVGYFTFYLATYKIKGKLNHKKEDNAPI